MGSSCIIIILITISCARLISGDCKTRNETETKRDTTETKQDKAETKRNEKRHNRNETKPKKSSITNLKKRNKH